MEKIHKTQTHSSFQQVARVFFPHNCSTLVSVFVFAHMNTYISIII